MALILIIEDNTDIRENTQEILEMEGYSVIVAENGKEGFEIAMLQKPELILCDVMMPKMNGYELIEELKKVVLFSNVPFIFITANSEKKDKQYGLNLGADDYIIKPFESVELLEKVKRVLINKQIVE